MHPKCWDGAFFRERFPIGDFGRWHKSTIQEDASILREMTLADVVLPGTHDAGAYALTSKLMPGARFPTPWEAAAIAIAEDLGINVDRVITPWALTQSLDVLAQHEFGYRYDDVSTGWNGTGRYANHAEEAEPVKARRSGI